MLSPEAKHLAIRNARLMQDEIPRAAALGMTESRARNGSTDLDSFSGQGTGMDTGGTRVRAALLVLFLLLALAAPPASASAQEPNQAVLIVDYGNGTVASRCQSFAEANITGTDLLARSGMTVQVGTGVVGMQVCKIDDVGCDLTQGENCWCQCMGVDCLYWNYFQWRDGSWEYSSVGGALRQLGNGDADAWVWGDGKTPPSIAPEGVCDGAQAAPTATPAPAAPQSSTLTPTPLSTFTPTATVAATATASSAASPTSASGTESAATAVPTSAPTAMTTPTVGSAATATATPTQVGPPTTTPTPRPLPSQIGATASPVPAPGPAPAGRGLGSYLGWAALAAVALAIGALALRRRR